MVDTYEESGTRWRKTKRQVVLYGIVGAVQLLVDWGCFVLLTTLGIDVVPANICARIVGATLGFWLNGRLTFRGDDAKLGPRQATKYVLSWSTMALFSTLAVWATEKIVGIGSARIAKPFIDIVLAALGFLASKLWIYR